MTAPTLDTAPLGEVCPCCRRVLLDRVTVSAWRGQTICCWCRADLDSHDAEDARRNVQQMTRRIIVTMREEP